MKRKLMFAVGIAALSTVPAVYGASNTGTTDLTVTIGPEASMTIPGTTALTSVGTNFANFTGTTSFTYKIRTTTSGGAGSIVVQVANFQANGPAVTDLSYVCTGAAAGTPCSGPITASNSSSTSVATFGADAHSADTGDSASTAWTMVDRPTVKTGNYDAIATYTISAT